MKLNWDCLREIKTTAESSKNFLEFRNKSLPKELQSVLLSDDMVNIIDYIFEKSNELAFSHPSFSNSHSAFFKKYGVIYHIYQGGSGLSIIANVSSANIGKKELKGYSKEEFLRDYDIYYYYDVNDNKVRCFWNDLPYIITEEEQHHDFSLLQ